MESRERFFDRCQQDRRADLLKTAALFFQRSGRMRSASKLRNSLLSRTYTLPASRAFRKQSIDEELVPVNIELPVLRFSASVYI